LNLLIMASSREKLADLHDLLVDAAVEKIRSGEASTKEMEFALALCKNSNISAVVSSGSSMARLAKQVDFGDLAGRVVQLRANG
jgi:hypothetical protein